MVLIKIGILTTEDISPFLSFSVSRFIKNYTGLIPEVKNNCYLNFSKKYMTFEERFLSLK